MTNVIYNLGFTDRNQAGVSMLARGCRKNQNGSGMIDASVDQVI